MTSINHHNNLCSVTLYFPSSISPSSFPVPNSSTSSSSWTDKIKQKIEELKSKLESLNNLIEAKNNYLSEEDSKSLDSLPTQVASLETVHKLAEFAEQLDTNNNASNNILTNLCTGLEKFLGFNPASKGYDGTGIVYSDLDRLCDGVMGFLYQVLKDVSEKQPYSVGKNTLNNNILTLFNNHLCSGHDGFTKLLPSLTKQIEKYNREVRDSNEKVSTPIEKLLDEMKELKNQVSVIDENNVSQDSDVKKAVKPANTFFNEGKYHADTFLNDINNANKNMIDLNINCKNNVENAVKSVRHEARRLHALSRKAWEDLWRMEEKIKNVLTKLGADIKSAVTSQLAALVNDLIARVSYIKIHLMEINNHLWRSIRDLNEWIENNKKLMEPAITDVSSIVNKEVGLEYQGKIRTVAKQLKERSTVLQNYIEKMKTEIRHNVNAALEAVKTMNDKLKEDLKGVKEGIKTKIWQHVSELISPQFEEIKRQVVDESGTTGIINENWLGLKTFVKAHVDLVTGEGGWSDAGLAQIVKGVIQFAKNFDDAKEQGDKLDKQFGDIIKEWIQTILDENSLVKDSLAQYVKEAGNDGKIAADFKKEDSKGYYDGPTAAITSAIKEQLEDEIIRNAVKTFNIAPEKNTGDASKISEYINKIHTVCSTFATELGDRIKSGQMYAGESNSFLNKIANAIETKMLMPGQYSTNQRHLKSAVTALITALQCTAKQLSAQMDRFRNTAKMDNVEKALNRANQIAKQFDGSDNNGKKISGYPDYGFNIDTALGIVKGPVNSLHTALQRTQVEGDTDRMLTSEIGTDDLVTAGGVNKISAFAQDKFREYVKQVNQDTLTLEIDKLEGTLPAAIKKIGNDASVFTVNPTKSDLETWFNDLTFNLNSLLMTMSETADSIKWNLEHGNENIKTGLSTIRDNVHNVHKDINNIIQTAESFITKEADEEKNKTIKTLTEFVSSQISAATSTLTTLARKQYVTSVKDLLTAFAKKVTEELSPLPDLIDKDRREGFKGFMRTIQGTINRDGETSTDNIDKLSNIATTITSPNLVKEDALIKLSKEFRNFYWTLQKYITSEINRLNDEENKKRHPQGSGLETYVDEFFGVGASLTVLLEHISGKHKYDHRVPGMLDDLVTAISKVKPENFSKPNTPTMDCITAGLNQFVAELKKVYISVYDSTTFVGDFLELNKTIANTREVVKIYDLTAEGRDCAKVFLTCASTLFNESYHMFQKCTLMWEKCDIKGEEYGDDLRKYLTHQGFDIQNLRTSLTGLGVTGKLFKGFNPYGEFNKHPKDFSTFDECIEHFRKHEGPLVRLFDYLDKYYRVCHLSTFTSNRHPSTIYEMLQWLTGLPYNSVYGALSQAGFGDLFDKPEVADADSDTLVVSINEDPDSLNAYPKSITATGLSLTLTEVCHQAEETLISILGHGHSEGRYACDFDTNPDKFAYPSDPSKCLDMLFEISLRLQEQLYLLYTFCKGTRDTMSWRECWYGRGVGGSSWKCNTMLCPNQQADQKAGQSADQKHNQTCNQKCNQTANCGLKSPLQSFLEDGLPGFLPHPYSKSDCKMTCSLSNHRGIPCKTPMGFSDLSVMASHTSKGERIVEALRDFCGQSNKPLNQLCSLLLCILSRPPQTLGDMFAFYYNFISDWNGKGSEHKRDAFNGAVNDAYFGAQYQDFTINNVFGSHIHDKNNHPKGDLFGLVDCYSGKGDRTPKGSCGPYMRPICGDIRNTFASKHAGNYLSWIVYITETFYDLLKKLFEECNKCCGEDKPRCRAARCSRNCNFNGKTPDPNHADSCDSIVNCKFTRPTLYQYGFVHEDALMLADKPTKRTCKDFCKALKTVLSDKVDDDAALAKLVYVTIPEFLFKIRAPFIWLNVALWLLSLLYLLHIMVIRLDLLHIKSHLHSPSSHRIAAQSLLAAGRVNKLNRVFYLQP